MEHLCKVVVHGITDTCKCFYKLPDVCQGMSGDMASRLGVMWMTEVGILLEIHDG